MTPPSDDTALPAPPVEVFLSPGAVHCTSVPSRVTTILGSCVAVCLWDRVRRVGGINHFILPYRRQERPSSRFGDFAIAHLVDEMQRLGCDLGAMRAKVFGGAAVLPFASGGDPVGEQNVRVAMEWLREHGIPVIAQRTGGRSGLVVRLFTESGDVLVRRVATIAVGTARSSHISPAQQGRPGDNSKVARLAVGR
jgi:chemotaxis protein CheD